MTICALVNEEAQLSKRAKNACWFSTANHVCTSIMLEDRPSDVMMAAAVNNAKKWPPRVVKYLSPVCCVSANPNWRQVYVRNLSVRDSRHTIRRRWCSDVIVRSEPNITWTSGPKQTFGDGTGKARAYFQKRHDQWHTLSTTSTETNTREGRRTTLGWVTARGETVGRRRTMERSLIFRGSLL